MKLVPAVLASPKSKIFSVQSDFTTILLGFKSCKRQWKNIWLSFIKLCTAVIWIEHPPCNQFYQLFFSSPHNKRGTFLNLFFSAGNPKIVNAHLNKEVNAGYFQSTHNCLLLSVTGTVPFVGNHKKHSLPLASTAGHCTLTRHSTLRGKSRIRGYI